MAGRRGSAASDNANPAGSRKIEVLSELSPIPVAKTPEMHIRQFFVKSDNLWMPPELRSTQVVNIPKDGSVDELYQAVRDKYRIPDKINFYLLTNPLGMGGKRIEGNGPIDETIQNAFIKVPIFMGGGASPKPRHRQGTMGEFEIEI